MRLSLRLFSSRSFVAILIRDPSPELLQLLDLLELLLCARLTLCFLKVTAGDSVASERFSTASIYVDRRGRRRSASGRCGD